MKAKGKTTQEILRNVPRERLGPFKRLHEVIVKNLPKGFEPAISYGGLGYVVPHKRYPPGYHCRPEEPLPFAGIASQKRSISLCHIALYADPKLRKWFLSEYPKHTKQKLDMGRSCVRFNDFQAIPCRLMLIWTTTAEVSPPSDMDLPLWRLMKRELYFLPVEVVCEFILYLIVFITLTAGSSLIRKSGPYFTPSFEPGLTISYRPVIEFLFVFPVRVAIALPIDLDGMQSSTFLWISSIPFCLSAGVISSPGLFARGAVRRIREKI